MTWRSNKEGGRKAQEYQTLQVQTFGEGVKVSPGTREAEFSSRVDISDPLEPLKMNVLGPDYRQIRLRRGQNDAVRQGSLRS